MNPEFGRVLAAAKADRRGLFVQTSQRMGCSERYVEKDFWVCWALDVLFNSARGEPAPRLLFKGGTSLSKAFGLISRFSEDIDITVFREDLGVPATVADLESLSNKKREARLDEIRNACQEHIRGRLLESVRERVSAALTVASLPATSAQVEMDPEDHDGQTILFWYPRAFEGEDEYVKPVVRIECGAKSALDPHSSMTVLPYVAQELGGEAFAIKGVTTVDARRTFWDKVVILHGARRWFDEKGEMLKGGDRVSRHYHDVHRLLNSGVGREALADSALGKDCARHARMFFNRTPFRLDAAVDGHFSVAPALGMLKTLESDYEKMSGMIFGEVPSFSAVIESINELERRLSER